MRVLYLLALCFAAGIILPAQRQAVNFHKLEDQVYTYNNQARYEQSQALLLPLIHNPAYTPIEQLQAAILLSYTYKRLLDYTTALKWLGTAYRLADHTASPDSNRVQIQTQFALAYFDIHRYGRADSLMRALARTGFRYVDQENRAKLVHQQGYLLFLDRRYAEAEATYDRAMIDLKAASPCDLPMILVKKMQLYAAMNQMPRVEATLKQTIRCADSCGIINYSIYAYSELKTIYKIRHDNVALAKATTTLDSLNTRYQQANHIADMHNQQQSMEQQKQQKELASKQQWLTGALVCVGLLGLLVMGLVGSLRLRQAQQRRLEAELDRMRTELTTVVTTPLPPPADPVLLASLDNEPDTQKTHGLPPQQPDLSILSERQQDVLKGIIDGLSNRDIADKLYISENTVKYHIKNIYVLLDVKDRVALLIKMSEGRKSI